jgi:hypothetical protein
MKSANKNVMQGDIRQRHERHALMVSKECANHDRT